MVMSYLEQTRYISSEVSQLCQRLCREGMDLDLIYAMLINQAAYGYGNMEGGEVMGRVFRETADEIERGEYRHATTTEPPRPSFSVIEGGRGGIEK